MPASRHDCTGHPRIDSLLQGEGLAGAHVHRFAGLLDQLALRRLVQHDDRAVVLALVEQLGLSEHTLSGTDALAGVRDDLHGPRLLRWGRHLRYQVTGSWYRP